MQAQTQQPPAALNLPGYSVFSTSGPKTLHTTIGIIGRAIDDGARYEPLRRWAGWAASRAPAKDYMRQAINVYDDVTRNKWRYVKNVHGVENVVGTGEAAWKLTLGAGAPAGSKGFGDCGEITAALGAALKSIGFPVRMVTISKPGSRQLFEHIYPVAQIPRAGWIAFDAVGYPVHGAGWQAPSGRYGLWDTKGRLLKKKGRFGRSLQQMFRGLSGQDTNERDPAMTSFPDQGLETVGLAGYESPVKLRNWNETMLKGFGVHAASMGTISGDAVPNLLMEYDESDTFYKGGFGMVRTKMLEMSPQDFEHVRYTGFPRYGSVALADDGDVYQYTLDPTLGGFFKKIVSGVKKVGKKIVGGVKKVAKGVVSTAKSLISKLPGGKYLVKLYDKVHKTAMKLVRPLTKFVGKYASKLAPIAALIPGYGPAIAGALYTAGKIAKVLQKTGVTTDSKGKPKFKSGTQAKRFKKELNKAAREEKKRGEKAKRAKQKERAKRKKVRAKKKAKRGERREERAERQMEARIIKRLQKQGLIQRPTGGPARLIKTGTEEHAMELRGLGYDVDERL